MLKLGLMTKLIIFSLFVSLLISLIGVAGLRYLTETKEHYSHIENSPAANTEIIDYISNHVRKLLPPVIAGFFILMLVPLVQAHCVCDLISLPSISI